MDEGFVMHKIIGVLLIALMVGCTQVDIKPSSEVGTINNVQPLNGPAVATQLNTLYNRKSATFTYVAADQGVAQ
ncbi:hypothetical protein BK661_01890 [Pseudomonas frederiksbergensis]|jgi:hypothetical protein|uniref:Uncharacterized protein n=2 Tax=Pseudomonas TaxID=286 RepID=A0A423JHH3_9PSED|nr:hypothetical protein BK661_01890 [Pseudomonas frederiksbergensis]